jgi:hypothetical protein
MKCFFIALIVCFPVVLESNRLWAEEKTAAQFSGVSNAQLLSFAQHLPEVPGRIQSLRFLQGAHTPSIAISTFSSESGWQLLLFENTVGNEFAERWRSGKLSDSFRVSSSDALKTFNFGDEEGIEFEGCAPHVCSDVFSILFYVPSRDSAFTVTSTFGKLTYSSNVLLPENLRYRNALDQLVKNH